VEEIMWDYTDKTKDHFLNQRNVGFIDDFDGIGEVGSLACGDALKLTFKLDESKRIADAKFQTFGCASAIASSSALTEIIKGMSLEEAAKVTNEDIADYLGGLPKEKMHCSVMGRDAMEKAIAYYRGEAEKKIEGEIVCECFGVSDVQIERAVRENGLTSIEDVTDYVKAGGGCGNCHDKIQFIIDRVLGNTPRAAKKPEALTNIQKIKMIDATLEREIKPALNQDGGDIELVDVDGNRVLVKLRGTCASCSKSQITLKHYVETKLKELVSQDLVVEEV
jgi:NifU-like protein